MRTSNCFSRLRAAAVTELCAVWLGILAVLPFTAPFATLDAADFFGGGHEHTASTPVIAASSSIPAQDDDADDAAASDAVFQRVNPANLGGLAPIPMPIAVDAMASAAPVVPLRAVAV